MRSERSGQCFKNINTGVVVILSILSMGIYIGYWFLKERRTLKAIDHRGFIPVKLWWVFTVFLCFSFLFNLLGEALFTPYVHSVIESLDVILSFYFLGFLYYTVFRMRDLLEERYEELLLHPWLLVFFHVWYLQNKINRLEGTERENRKEALQQ